MKLLHLANFYQLRGARDRAIGLLNQQSLCPGKKLAIATQHDITSWVRDAVLKIVYQSDAKITALDGVNMGMVFHSVKKLTDTLTSFRMGLAYHAMSSFRQGYLCPFSKKPLCRQGWRKEVWPHIQRMLLAGGENSLTVREIFDFIIRMPYVVVKKHICKSCMEFTLRHIKRRAIWELEEKAIKKAVAFIERRIRMKNF